MKLSTLAVKALIGFSLGLSANTLTANNFSDTSKVKRTSCEAKNNKKKPLKAQKNAVTGKTGSDVRELSSCGKCGKG